MIFWVVRLWEHRGGCKLLLMILKIRGLLYELATSA